MNITVQRRLDLGLTGDLLLSVLVVLAFLSIFALPDELLRLGDYVLLAVASLAYLLVGIYGWKCWERTRSPLVALLYFATQLSLGAFIYYWSFESAWIILMPLASQSIELPWRWTLLVCLLLLASSALPGLFPGRLLAAGLLQPGEPNLSAFLAVTLEFSAALIFVLLFSGMIVRERQSRAALDKARKRLSEYAVQVADLAMAQERARLAREVHDSLGHHLTAIHVHLQAARELLDSQPALALDAVDKARALASEGLVEVRRSVAALRASPLAGCTLQEALASLAGDCRQAGLPADLEVQGTVRELSPLARQALFRAAQEGLTNARKHAQADRVVLRLDYRDTAVCLTVQDDGLGAAHTDGGFGLLGVQERVTLLGGRVELFTAPGEGFTLYAEVPG
ncbi:MAG: sensor histidine kinase [Anaerolineae bacterium]|nr:sensor histidine kinase [Anaerolineae bacterium]